MFARHATYYCTMSAPVLADVHGQYAGGVAEVLEGAAIPCVSNCQLAWGKGRLCPTANICQERGAEGHETQAACRRVQACMQANVALMLCGTSLCQCL